MDDHTGHSFENPDTRSHVVVDESDMVVGRPDSADKNTPAPVGHKHIHVGLHSTVD